MSQSNGGVPQKHIPKPSEPIAIEQNQDVMMFYGFTPPGSEQSSPSRGVRSNRSSLCMFSFENDDENTLTSPNAQVAFSAQLQDVLAQSVIKPPKPSNTASYAAPSATPENKDPCKVQFTPSS